MSKKTASNNKLTTEFSEDVIKWLKKESERNDTSMSWVIRQAVKKKMESEDATS